MADNLFPGDELQMQSAEPIGFDKKPEVAFIPNPKDPKLNSVAVPVLKHIQLQPIKGFDQDDYLRLANKLQPIDAEVEDRMNSAYQSVDLEINDFIKTNGGVITPDKKIKFSSAEIGDKYGELVKQKNEQLNAAQQSILSEATRKFKKTLSEEVKPKQQRKIERKANFLAGGPSIGEPKVSKPEFDPEDVNTQDVAFAKIQGQINTKKAQLEVADQGQAEVILKDIDNLEKQKSMFTKAAAPKQDIPDGVYISTKDNQPLGNNFIKGKAYDLNVLKAGDLIFPEDGSSNVRFFEKRNDKVYISDVPVSQRFKTTKEEQEAGAPQYRDENVYAYRVWVDANGEKKLAPVTKPSPMGESTLDDNFFDNRLEWVKYYDAQLEKDPGNKELIAKREKLVSALNQSSTTGATDLKEIIITPTPKKGKDEAVSQFMQELDKGIPGTVKTSRGNASMTMDEGVSRIFPDLMNKTGEDGRRIASFLFQNKEYSKGFAEYIGNHVKEGKIFNSSVAGDWRRMMDEYEQSQLGKINNKQSKLNVTPQQFNSYSSLVSKMNVLNTKFEQYSDGVLAKIEALKGSKDPASVERYNQLVTAYNKSLEIFKSKQQQLKAQAGEYENGSDVLQYAKLEEEKSELSLNSLVLRNQFTYNAPSLEKIEDNKSEQTKAFDGQKKLLNVLNPGYIGFDVGKRIATRVGELALGIMKIPAAIAGDNSYSQLDYYRERLETSKIKLNDKNTDGSTNYGNFFYNAALDAADTAPDLLAMFLTPEIKGFQMFGAGIRRAPGLMLTIGVPHYYDNYKSAEAAGLKGAWKHFYALATTTIETATESFFDLPSFSKGVSKGLKESLIKDIKRNVTGELVDNMPRVLSGELSKQSLINSVSKKIATGARNFLSRENALNIGKVWTQEFFVEETISAALNNVNNIAFNESFGSNLDETLLYWENLKKIYASGLMMAPILSSGNVINKTAAMTDRETRLYAIANEVGFDKVYSGINSLIKEYKKAGEPKDVDIEFANKMYEELPIAWAMNKPADVDQNKWALAMPYMVQYQKIKGQQDNAPEALKQWNNARLKELSAKVGQIFSLSTEAAAQTIEKINTQNKEEAVAGIKEKAANKTEETPVVKTPESQPVFVGETIRVEGAPEGTHLNVGLLVGRTNQQMTPEQITEKLPEGVTVVSQSVVNGSEPTLSLQISRPLTNQEMDKFLDDTEQQAIPQLHNSEGVLFDKKRGTPEARGEFNPEFFVKQDGQPLTKAEVPVAINQTQTPTATNSSNMQQTESAEVKADNIQHTFGNQLPQLINNISDLKLDIPIEEKKATLERIKRVASQMQDDGAGVIDVQAINNAVASINENSSVQEIESAEQVIKNELGKISDKQTLVDRLNQQPTTVQEPRTEEINEQPVEEDEFELAEEDIVNQIASDYANAITGDIRDGVIMLGKALKNAWSSFVPNLKVVTDNYRANLQDLADQGLIEPDMVDVYMTYPGMYFNNTVFLNPDRVGLDTPIHEFGHVWYQVAKQVRPEVIERGRSLIRGSQYLRDVQNTPEYANLTPEQMEEEALITAIGDRGAKFVEQSILTQFKDWLKELFDAIGMLAKSHTGKPIDVSSLSLDEYLDVAAQDILSGGKVLLNEVSAEAVSSFAYEGATEGVTDGVKINLSLQATAPINNLTIVNGFYSPIEKRLNETKIEKQSANKWLTVIGKGDEATWAGVRAWLESKPPTETVSKQDIQQWMKDNRIEIKEVVKSDEKFSFPDEKLVEMNQLLRDEDLLGFDTIAQAREAIRTDADFSSSWDIQNPRLVELGNEYRESVFDFKSAATKFTSYQLEGEKENYKEMLVVLPPKLIDKNQFDTFSQIEEAKKQDQLSQFKSSHFDEPNILVHLRMNTRTDAQGNKVLFLEEVQSDWGQKGKKDGFKNTEYEDFINELKSKYSYENGKFKVSEIGEENADKLERLQREANVKITPQAPFVTDTNAWVKLGLKVALKEAVKQGVDKIAWTTGEQQNERYDLSKQVDLIQYRKNEDGTYSYYAEKNGKEVADVKGRTIRQIEDELGKEVADKMQNNIGDKPTPNEAGGWLNLTGDNLKVGGKGMKGFYGNPADGSLGIVGNVAKSLFKQEVSTSKIDTKTIGLTKETSAALDEDGWTTGVSESSYSVQHSVKLTPELIAETKTGLPMFSIASSKRIESVLPSFKTKVAQAEKMLAEGKSAEQIYKATNLSKGIEGDWQYDMDYNVVLKPSVKLTAFRTRLEQAKPGSGLTLKLPDAISYPMLFQMYPELRNTEVSFVIDQDDYIAGVNRGAKKILINLDKQQFYEVEDMAAQYGVTGEGAVDKGYTAAILHEVQHLIQIADNMPLGTSPEISFKHAAEKVANVYRKEAEITGEQDWNQLAEEVVNLDYQSKGEAADYVRAAADLRYRISAGEVQARNVEMRFFNESARYLPVESTEDIPRNKQIIDRDKTPALSVATKNKIANPVKAVRDVMESNPYKKFMTEDGDNYYFFHWSDDERKVIDPAKFGSNTITSREERIARPSAAFFYTRPDFAERGVGDYGHVVKVPKHKVYPATADPLGFVDKAREMFDKAHPGMAFGANQQIGWVTKVANANGFDMVVAKWGDQLRAETTEKIKVEVYRQPQGWGVKYNPKYEKLKRGMNESLGSFTIKKSVKSSKPLEFSADNRIPGMVENVKRSSIDQFDGKDAVIISSDRLTTGFVDHELLDKPHRKLGGIFYPAANKGFLWASSTKNKANSIIRDIVYDKDGNGHIAVMAMGDDSHMSNYNAIIFTMDILSGSGLKPKDIAENINRASVVATGSKIVSPNDSVAEISRKVKEFFSVENAKFDARKPFLQSLLGKTKSGVNKMGLPDFNSVSSILREPSLEGVRNGSIVSIIKFNGKPTVVETSSEKDGEIYHESYPFVIKTDGEVEVHLLDKAHNVEDVLPEFTTKTNMNIISYDKSAELYGEQGATRYTRNVFMAQPTARLSIRSRFGLSDNWAEDAIRIAQTSLYDGTFELRENQGTGQSGFTLFINGKPYRNFNTAEEGIEERDRLIRRTIMRIYPQVSELVASNILNNAKRRNVTKPVGKKNISGVMEDVRSDGFKGDTRTRAEKLKDFSKYWMKRLFTHTKGVDKWVFDLNIRRMGQLNFLVSEAEGVVVKLNKTAKDIGFDNWDLFDQAVRDYNTYTPSNPFSIANTPNYLPGQQTNPLGNLPQELQPFVVQMRSIIDGISMKLAEDGLVSPDMALTIEQNLGKYMHRSYAMFTMGDSWVKKLRDTKEGKAITDAAHEALTKLYYTNIMSSGVNISHDEANAQAQEEANKEIERIMATRRPFFGGDEGSFLPYRNTGSLKQKGDLPKWLRDLLGEYTDVRTAFLLTVAETGTLLQTSQYLAQLRDNGMGKILWEEGVGGRPAEASFKISSGANSLLKPLEGLYTTKEIYDMLNEVNEGMGKNMRLLLKVMNINKMMKTVLSVPTQMKNFISNTGFALHNGHFDVSHRKKSGRYWWQQFTNKKNLDFVKELEPLYVRGVLNQSLTARELQEIFKLNDIEQYIVDAAEGQSIIDRIKNPGRELRKFERGASRIYQASDDFWKIYAFYNERSDVSSFMFNKKYDQLTEQEKNMVDNEAADRVMNTYPTYDRVLDIFRTLSKTGVLGNFIAFRAEVFRVAANSYAYAFNDIKTGLRTGNRQQVAIGLKRFSGISTYNALRMVAVGLASKAAGYGIAGISSIIAGAMGDDDEEKKRHALNSFVADWARSDDKIYSTDKIGKDGSFEYYTLSSLDPYATIYNIANAFTDGNEYDKEGGADAALLEVVAPFTELEMTISAFAQAYSNKDPYGFQVYNEDESYWGKMFSGSMYVTERTLTPGTITWIKRMWYRKDEQGKLQFGFNLSEANAAFGARPYVANIGRVWSSALIKASKDVFIDVPGDFKRATNLGDEYKNEANERWNNQILKLHRMYTDAIKLGYPAEKLNESFQRMDKRVVNAIKTGVTYEAFNNEGKIKSSSSSSSRPNTRASSRPSTRR